MELQYNIALKSLHTGKGRNKCVACEHHAHTLLCRCNANFRRSRLVIPAGTKRWRVVTFLRLRAAGHTLSGSFWFCLIIIQDIFIFIFIFLVVGWGWGWGLRVILSDWCWSKGLETEQREKISSKSTIVAHANHEKVNTKCMCSHADLFSVS